MLGLVISLWLGSIARAERADHNKPMNIQSDNMTYNDAKKINIFTGNVTVTKGTILLKAERLQVMQDPEGYSYATAFAKPGDLAYICQKRDNSDEYICGWGEKIEYNSKVEVAKITTRALLKRLTNTKILDEIHGSTITYNLYKETYTANGGRDQVSLNNPSGRVRATLSPQHRSTQSEPTAASNYSSAPISGISLHSSKRIGNPCE
ncbi:lipopolysaccharide transport periplasmic protein LptA [Candidatus Pandoraea novymonadis]|uniref:Lipopolysaccharide export system protein LptA n=1 Tax=Candidatus Pandoraea novymonadis TaxID=1808959 RepID=A0ABX5FDE9_9BURK|nr:lipopolysaccharide transport periplasmic protein LptA [Candidatus Pandoraea novymonadis]PSB91778.1 Lipopolysaccharide export system protein LptA [Candidatus Pandoraea novymonadis]